MLYLYNSCKKTSAKKIMNFLSWFINLFLLLLLCYVAKKSENEYYIKNLDLEASNGGVL